MNLKKINKFQPGGSFSGGGHGGGARTAPTLTDRRQQFYNYVGKHPLLGWVLPESDGELALMGALSLFGPEASAIGKLAKTGKIATKTAKAVGKTANKAAVKVGEKKVMSKTAQDAAKKAEKIGKRQKEVYEHLRTPEGPNSSFIDNVYNLEWPSGAPMHKKGGALKRIK